MISLHHTLHLVDQIAKNLHAAFAVEILRLGIVMLQGIYQRSCQAVDFLIGVGFIGGKYGKLKSITAQRKKRRITYEVMIESFEKGRFYSEWEVNIMIADFHDDFCTIRRDMISEKLLDREGSNYWLL